MWPGWELRENQGRWKVGGNFTGGFCWERNIEYCLLLREGGEDFVSFFSFYILLL